MRKSISELPVSFRVNYLKDQPLSVRKQIREYLDLDVRGVIFLASQKGNKSQNENLTY